MVTVRKCIQADKEHKLNERQYAHVHHVKGNTICVAGAWLRLPLHEQMGLIAHEVGHLLVGNIDHTEEEADRTGNKFFKVTILYRNSIFGNHLQYLSKRDTLRVYSWALYSIKFRGRLFA
jgi:hypothetical protein